MPRPMLGSPYSTCRGGGISAPAVAGVAGLAESVTLVMVEVVEGIISGDWASWVESCRTFFLAGAWANSCGFRASVASLFCAAALGGLPRFFGVSARDASVVEAVGLAAG